MGLDISSDGLYNNYHKNLNAKIELLKNTIDQNNIQQKKELNKKIKLLKNNYQEDCGLWYEFRISYNNNPLNNLVLNKHSKDIYSYLETHKAIDQDGNERDYPFPILSTEGVKKLLQYTLEEYETYKTQKQNFDENQDSFLPPLFKNFESELKYFEGFIEYLQWHADNDEDLVWDC